VEKEKLIVPIWHCILPGVDIALPFSFTQRDVRGVMKQWDDNVAEPDDMWWLAAQQSKWLDLHVAYDTKDLRRN